MTESFVHKLHDVVERNLPFAVRIILEKYVYIYRNFVEIKVEMGRCTKQRSKQTYARKGKKRGRKPAAVE